MSETYLQLSPQHGGHRFGPFRTGAVYFGTDRSKCQIILDSSSGVGPCHAILTIAPNQTYTLSATSRSHPVFVVPPGSSQAYACLDPVTIQAGSTIYLGSIQGPQFSLIRHGAQPNTSPPGAAPPGRRPGQPGYGDAIGQEVHRQVESHLLTKVPAFRIFQEYWYKYKTGVLSQPRNIIALVVIALGFVGTGCMGCVSSIIAVFAQILS